MVACLRPRVSAGAGGAENYKMMKCTTGWYVIKCKLNAGGNWTNAANCRSRCRNANNGHVNANSNIGRRSRIQELFGQTPGWIYWPSRKGKYKMESEWS